MARSSTRMQKAELLNIGINPDSPWAMLRQNLDIVAPYPEIKDQNPGYYNMVWNIGVSRTKDLGVNFDLLDVRSNIVDTLSLPAMPYFSGHLVAARSVFETPQMRRPIDNALREMFKDNADSDYMELTNRLLAEQSKAFGEKMNRWIDFSEQRHILPQLQLMIGSTITMLDPRFTRDEMLVCLPGQRREL